MGLETQWRQKEGHQRHAGSTRGALIAFAQAQMCTSTQSEMPIERVLSRAPHVSLSDTLGVCLYLYRVPRLPGRLSLRTRTQMPVMRDLSRASR